MTAPRDLTCPVCSSELTIEQMFASEETQDAFNALARVSIPVGSRVLSYISLFTPAKNRLTVVRKVQLLKQLLPDLQREQITRAGRDWPAPLHAWATAIEQMLASVGQGKLVLPLSNHAYLYSILQGMADKVERTEETQREDTRRTAAQTGVRPAEDNATGPMPAYVKDALANLKFGRKP